MLLRLDEVGENYENLEVKVISYTSNKAEQSRVRRKQLCRWSSTTSVEVRCTMNMNGTMWMRSKEIEDVTIVE